MTKEIIDNVAVVTAEESFIGRVEIEAGVISAIEAYEAYECSDSNRDIVIPGLIDLHTDNVERHFLPRPAVRWPVPLAAALAHDREILSAGITTVFDALAIGDFESGGVRNEVIQSAIHGIDAASNAGALYVNHFYHLRAELTEPALPTLLERYLAYPAVRLLSMMDHTPGQGQYRDLEIYREYQRKKRGFNWTDNEFIAYIDRRKNIQDEYAARHRLKVSQFSREMRIPLASHDDASREDVDVAFGNGARISEFPVTLEAAQHARTLGMCIAMGAPNIVLGKSHSGNVSASELLDAGVLDILTSDYVPSSLLSAAFAVPTTTLKLHEAIALVTARPAEIVGLSDRGRISVGLRADLLRVRLVSGVPITVGTWIGGKRYF